MHASGKSIQCIIGDYELLCVLRGCLAPVEDVHVSRPRRRCSFVESLKVDHERFTENGACLERAKERNNATRPSLIPIAQDWVCIPALHLDLGMYSWMLDAFLADSRALDVQLTLHLGETGLAESDSALFTEAASISTKISNMSKHRYVNNR